MLILCSGDFMFYDFIVIVCVPYLFEIFIATVVAF